MRLGGGAGAASASASASDRKSNRSRSRDRSALSSDSYMLDPLLLPRLEQFSYNNSPLDLDSSVDYLRRNYREYARKQQAPFRTLVLRAILILQKRSPVQGKVKFSCRESKLQQQEEAHFRRRQEVQNGRGSLSSLGSDSDDSSCSEDHSENDIGSDGDELEKGSFVSGSSIHEANAEGKSKVEEERGSGEREDRNGYDEEQNCRKRKPARAFLASKHVQKKGKLEDGSDSVGEDEVLGVSPMFNLLNSSLRSTYHGRPALFLDADPVQGPGPLKNNTLKSAGKAGSPKVSAEADDSVAPFASVNQAFAPPEVIAAAAARAASKAGKKQSKQLGSNATSGKISAGVSDVENPTLSQDGAMTGAKVNESSLKCDGKSVQSSKTLEVKGQVNRTVETGTANHQRKAGNSMHSKKSKGPNNQVKESVSSSAESVRFTDLGGIDNVLDLIRELTFPLYNSGVYSWLGLNPIGGVLLHGPPGCGKTKLANAIAYETGLPFLKISAPEVVSGMSGESEAKVRGLFAEAARLAPCIVFIDEIDAITSKRESANREMERRIVTQLMTCMDELSQSNEPLNQESDDSAAVTKSKPHVLIIGATNRPEALDPALRRPGRFDREILLGVPDENARAQILSVLAKNLRLEGSFDFKHIARCTPGFVGADLAALTREAGSIAIKRIVSSRDCPVPLLDEQVKDQQFEGDDSGINLSSKESMKSAEDWWRVPWTQDEMHALSITMQDFEEALKVVQPSTKREGFSAIPAVKWDDVGALESVQKSMEFFISRRIKHPEDYEALGLDMDTGFLLYGPPGCGKTLVAKAVANDAQANFIYIKGPELLNKYVGESELSVRMLFSRARSCAPCIIFFDEMDALAPRRGMDGNAVAERVLNQLLSEMDGAEKRKGVFMIGATNRPDMIDPAVLRPGRLGKLLYVPLPNTEGRLSILKTLTRRKPLSADVDLASIAGNKSCEGFSGADLTALVNEACIAALQESATTPGEKHEPLIVCTRHFKIALSQIFPSVSKQDLSYYEALPKKFNQR